MIPYDEICAALMESNHLELRSLVQDALHSHPNVQEWPKPQTGDAVHLAALAAITELLANHRNQTAPAWTITVEPIHPPRHLLKSAAKMKNLRLLCETQSPEPLRKRGLFAPPNFLQFA